MLYNREIEDELMIQFIILYAVNCADEPIAYADLFTVVQENCEISFTDMQLGLDNLIQTGHISEHKISGILTVYDVTEKGGYVIEFFYHQIPLIIREPIDNSIKQLYKEKRRREAVKSSIEPKNTKEFYTVCSLNDEDRTALMSLRIYVGGRDEAERMAERFKNNAADIYSGILGLFDTAEDNSNERDGQD